MTFPATLCDALCALAGLASLFTAGLFAIVIRTRKSSLAWINRLFICSILAIGLECLANLFSHQETLPPSQLAIRIQLYLSILICAILCIPLYRRVRRHPNYDELQAANQQLEYTKRLFKTFLDETPFAAFVVNEDDRFLYVNSHVARHHNATTEQMVGTTYSDWFPADLCAKISAQNALVRATGRKHEFVTELILPSGKAMCLSNKFVLPGPQGRSLLGVVSLEISEELQSKAIDSFLASIVELSPDAIYTVSDTQLLTTWNQAAQRIFGYSADEVIGRPASILAPAGMEHAVARVISLLERGAVLKDKEFVHVAKDCTIKHLLLSATKIKSFIGVGSSYAAIARDETEEIDAANEMNALNRELDLRAAALLQANKDLPLARSSHRGIEPSHSLCSEHESCDSYPAQRHSWHERTSS